MKKYNLIGQKFGRLTVVAESIERVNKKVYWICKCDCGNMKLVSTQSLTRGTTQSCGCYRSECVRQRRKTHGGTGSKPYVLWLGVKQRCFDKNNHAYKYYGDRGITMFEGWVDNFQAFYEYVASLPHFGEVGYSLDRINNNGNYEPGNLRFATASEQAHNRRSRKREVVRT